MAVISWACANSLASSSSLGSVSRAGLPSRSSSSAWPSTEAAIFDSLSPCCAALDEVGDALLEAFEVGQQQLGLDHLGVGDRVDLVRDVLDVVILEAAQDVDDGVDLADVAEELVAEPFALADAPFTSPAISTNANWVGMILAEPAIAASVSSRGSGTATWPTLGSIVQNG